MFHNSNINDDRKALGDEGEDIAANHLIKQGFKIIGRNVRYKIGEIDIIAKRGKELHFIEVKTGAETSFVPPLEEITPAKIKKIKRTAETYLADWRNGFKRNDLPPCYFDVVAIDLSFGEPKIECIFDAFD